MKHPNTKPRTGYLYRRYRGKYFPIESDVGTIYFCYEVMGERKAICLHTKDVEDAEKMAADLSGRFRWGPRQDYLAAIIAAGKDAERELNRHKAATTLTPISEAWARYIASPRRPNSADATLKCYKGQFDLFCKWAPRAAKFMEDITPTIAESYAKHLDSRVNSWTSNKHLTFLRLIWRVVAPEAHNPWAGLHSIIKSSTVPYRRLSHAECRAIYQEATGEYRLAVLMGYSTALRLADVVTMNATAIRRDQGFIVVEPQKVKRRKPAPVYIPILPELDRHLDSIKKTGPVFPEINRIYAYDGSKVSKLFRAIFDAAGATNTDLGTASFHSFRATFITQMDEAGVPPQITDWITGHAPQTMHERYSKPQVDLARESMIRAIKPITRGL